MMAGNITSLGMGGIISIISSLIWPENFDFEITRTTAGVRTNAILVSTDSSATTPSEEKDEEKNTIEPRIDSAAASIAELPCEYY